MNCAGSRRWAMRLCLTMTLATSLVSQVRAQGNGKLQIHFMDVWQGDGALLISPRGQTVLFDDGALGHCDKPVSYLQQLGLTKLDYHITSHYHADHFGCIGEVLHECPLQHEAYDRGGDYPSGSFTTYTTAVGSHRRTATDQTTLTLDAGTAQPVRINIVALNGNGVTTNNENDLSLVAVVHYGDFDAEIGGDLSGIRTDTYEDIETSVGPKVGQVEVYKVHHHGSRYSSNAAWLDAIKPKVGIISCGDGNRYGHPTDECLERLHQAGIKTYWTEQGAGATPDPAFDQVSGNIIVEVAAGAQTFTVRHNGTQTDAYPLWGATTTTTPGSGPAQYAWSKRSKVYHFATCSYVANISPENFAEGETPPPQKRLHQECPK